MVETREERWARREKENMERYYKGRTPGEQIPQNGDKHGFLESVKRRASSELQKTKQNIQTRIEHPEIYKEQSRQKRIKELESHSKELRAELEHAKLRRNIYQTTRPQPHPLSRRAYYQAREGHKPKHVKTRVVYVEPEEFREKPKKRQGLPNIVDSSDILRQRYW